MISGDEGRWDSALKRQNMYSLSKYMASRSRTNWLGSVDAILPHRPFCEVTGSQGRKMLLGELAAAVPTTYSQKERGYVATSKRKVKTTNSG